VSSGIAIVENNAPHRSTVHGGFKRVARGLLQSLARGTLVGFLLGVKSSLVVVPLVFARGAGGVEDALGIHPLVLAGCYLGGGIAGGAVAGAAIWIGQGTPIGAAVTGFSHSAPYSSRSTLSTTGA